MTIQTCQTCPHCGHTINGQPAPVRQARAARSTAPRVLSPDEERALNDDAFRAYRRTVATLQDAEFYAARLDVARYPLATIAAAHDLAAELRTRKATKDDRRRLEALQDYSRPSPARPFRFTADRPFGGDLDLRLTEYRTTVSDTPNGGGGIVVERVKGYDIVTAAA
jgi:hypothetical protein